MLSLSECEITVSKSRTVPNADFKDVEHCLQSESVKEFETMLSNYTETNVTNSNKVEVLEQ